MYSGLKEVDWKSDNYRNFDGDVHHGTVFRAGTDDIYKKLTLEDHSQPANFFEACCLQSPETFFDNVNYIEDSGYRLCVKGYEQAVEVLQRQLTMTKFIYAGLSKISGGRMLLLTLLGDGNGKRMIRHQR